MKSSIDLTRRKSGPKPATPEQAIERFWDNVAIGNSDSCWPWVKTLNPRGYGQATHKRWPWRAHRLAWFFTHGNIPEGFLVLHHCDNRSCCNPKHLYVGTWADNMRDRSVRGRCNTKKGSARKDAILTESQVAEIKSFSVRPHGFGRIMAKRFGVHEATISAIVCNKNWRQVQ